MPHERLAEVPTAFVVLEDDAEVSADDLRSIIDERLVKYKWLDEVEFVGTDDLPVNALGKVLKRELA